MSRECTARSSLSAIPPWRLSLERARREFGSLEGWLFSEAALALPLDQVEREQEARSREVNRLMLQAHIQARGGGDVGPAVEVSNEDGQIRLGRRRDHVRHPITIFGTVVATRLGYSAPGVPAVHPLDEQLALPKDSYSYEIQRRIVKAALQGPFDEATERVEEGTGVAIPKRSAEEMVKDAAVDFDAFYEQRVPPPSEQTGPIVVSAVDGKGIPMIKPTPPEEEKKPLPKAEEKKPKKKRMSTVATVYTTQPRIRTPEQVVESLFWPELKRNQDEKKAPKAKPEHKRVWASLKESKDVVIRIVILAGGLQVCSRRRVAWSRVGGDAGGVGVSGRCRESKAVGTGERGNVGAGAKRKCGK